MKPEKEIAQETQKTQEQIAEIIQFTLENEVEEKSKQHQKIARQYMENTIMKILSNLQQNDNLKTKIKKLINTLDLASDLRYIHKIQDFWPDCMFANFTNRATKRLLGNLLIAEIFNFNSDSQSHDILQKTIITKIEEICNQLNLNPPYSKEDSTYHFEAQEIIIRILNKSPDLIN